MIGTKLSHYSVVDKLGEGGMGVVWRAQDSKLGREVALKVLPEDFAQDAERMGRFEREAQVLAALNHPNIAAIYGLEDDDGKRALVMELVEGETLQERIQRGSLPLDEALRIALQVAAALEDAHDHGIIHRDLKPANIKITPKGQVKVLDFGLAKAMEGDPHSSGSHPQVTQSPTLTAQMTGVGVLLGTAAYMSPEQARGEAADRRADIWAFGVVLFEMLSGRTVYAGKTVSDTLAGVLARDPEWEELPNKTPRSIYNLIERCLEKEVSDRLQAIGEARITIDHYLVDPEADVAYESPGGVAAASTARRLLPWVVATVLAIGLGLALWGPWSRGKGNTENLRLSIELPPERPVFRGFGSSAVLSPDGQQVAYVLTDGGGYEIFLHSLDQWNGISLVKAEGPDRPYQPFFSPDGNWLGFVTPGELKKVPAKGGTPIALCTVNLCRGASWGPDGWIVFAGSPNSGLSRVPAAGGEPEVLTELDTENGETSHRWPQVLPNGKAVLFTSIAGENSNEASIQVLDLESGQRQVVNETGSFGRYVESGHVVYADGGTLFAIPFDLGSLSVTGSAAPVVEGVTTSGGELEAQYSTSPDGKLAYVTGAAGQTTLSQVMVDMDGRVEALGTDPGEFYNPSFSPDGTRLAVELQTGENLDIWIYDLERQIPMRLTFNEGEDEYPVWSPDGSTLYYASDREGEYDIYRRNPSGSGDAERVLERAGPQTPFSFSPDGTTLAFTEYIPGTQSDIWLLPLAEGGEPQPFLVSEFIEYGPEFSPDGRWIAYGSDESGIFEVYITSATGDGKWQVTNGGGAWPLWAPDGRSLFTQWQEGVSRATVDTSSGQLRVGRSELLVGGSFHMRADGNRYYDVSPDGRGFLLFQNQSQSSDSDHEHIRVVLNWFDELNETFAQYEQ